MSQEIKTLMFGVDHEQSIYQDKIINTLLAEGWSILEIASYEADEDFYRVFTLSRLLPTQKQIKRLLLAIDKDKLPKQDKEIKSHLDKGWRIESVSTVGSYDKYESDVMGYWAIVLTRETQAKSREFTIETDEQLFEMLESDIPSILVDLFDMSDEDDDHA